MPSVFISHASSDKPAAQAICAALESAGVTCWIAPRDVKPGLPYAQEIVRGIGACQVLMLVYSGAANASEMVLRELENAAAAKKAILPVKLDDVPACAEMRFYLGREQWVEARAGAIDAHLPAIVAAAKVLLGQAGPSDAGREHVGVKADRHLEKPAYRPVSAMPRIGCVVQIAVACVAVGMVVVGWPRIAGWTRASNQPSGSTNPGPKPAGTDPPKSEIDYPPIGGVPVGERDPGAPRDAGGSLAALVRARASLPQLRVQEFGSGRIVTLSGVVAHPDEVEMLHERLRDLEPAVKIEVQADAKGVARAVRAALEALGLEGVDANVRARPNEPAREIVVRYKAKAGVAKPDVEKLAKSYFLRPELVSVVEDP